MAEDAIEQAAAVELAEVQPSPAPPEPPKITSAAEWRHAGKRRWRVTLPSGITVKARKVDIGTIFADGSIDPEQLLQFSQPTTERDVLQGRIELARYLATMVVVEPRVVVPNGHLDDGAMLSSEVPSVDALAIVAWVMNPVTTMVQAVETDADE